MKKIIVTLLTISMITATGNTHAMFKNILNSLYKPQLSFENKQALVKQQFTMPQLPPDRIHQIERYNNLCKEFIGQQKIVKQDRKDLNKWRMLALPVFLMVVTVPFLGLPALFSWCGGHGCASDSYKKSKEEYKNIEQKLKDLKHELRIHDDIL